MRAKVNLKIAVSTYGCTFNQAKSDELSKALLDFGHELVDELKADAVIVNTCTVKDATEQKIVARLRKLDSLGKKLIVTGCLAGQNPKLVKKIAPNSLAIVHPKDLMQIVSMLTPGAGECNDFIGRELDGVIARLPISTGCLSNCTYCATKLVWGDLVSTPLEKLVFEAKLVVKSGAREIRLCSVDSGCYGFEKPSYALLPQLIDEIASLKGDFMVRVGMSSPQHFIKIMPALLKSFESPKVYKFAHIPVQSGSNSVLREMKRGYSREQFVQCVESLRNKFPQITIATDVIVGFPSETNEDFQATLDLMQEIQFDVVNVSKYSPRPFTKAAAMDLLSHDVVNSRSKTASELSRKIILRKNESRVGRVERVLVTEKTPTGFQARTINYLPVVLPKARVGAWFDVQITGFGQSHLKANVLNRAVLANAILQINK